jgi:DNA polymerase
MNQILNEIKKVLKDEAVSESYVRIAPETLSRFLSLKKKSFFLPPSDGGGLISGNGDEGNPEQISFRTADEPSILPREKFMNIATLAELEKIVSGCAACRLCERRTNIVFGEGNPNAELMFIGEGPGHDEDMQGRPFVGRAGQLLTKMIEAMQYDRKDVYIANIVKCRPPENRNPEKDEAAACVPFLRHQIELVHPKVIVLLGAVPAKFLLHVGGINEARGKWFDMDGIKTMPTYHPAYLLRQASAKKIVWADLKLVMAALGKKIQTEGEK